MQAQLSVMEAIHLNSRCLGCSKGFTLKSFEKNNQYDICFIYTFLFFSLQNERLGFVFIHRIKSWVDEGSALGPDRHARDIKSLDQYAMERWEVILHFMVGSSCAVVSQDLAQLLIQAGLMKRYTHRNGTSAFISAFFFNF